MKTLIDMHTHTGFSPDGEGTVEQSLAKAKELGLAAFAITDHCDCNFRYKADHYGDPEALKDGMMYGSGEYAPASIVAQYEAAKHLEGLNFSLRNRAWSAFAGYRICRRDSLRQTP